ncbi:hypothetical protein [Primorskyibacter sedentarius]|nr:hypothetical protein [Primorskyibacter sedentarius]
MARLADSSARGEAFTRSSADKLAAALPPDRVADLPLLRDRNLATLANFHTTLNQKD